MNYSLVIQHIQKVLNKCGDNVLFKSTGSTANFDTDISIEIETTNILKKNKCCEISEPLPLCKEEEEKYKINRIRISADMITDYEKGYPYSDETIIGLLKTKKGLFGCYN